MAPFWPRLEDLDVCLNITTPTGDWLYVRDPSEFVHGPGVAPPLVNYQLEENNGSTHSFQLEAENGSTHSTDSDSSVPETYPSPLIEYLDGRSSSDQFRIILDGKRLHPMLMAMAHAAADDRMPAMHRMALHLNPNSLGGLDVECTAILLQESPNSTLYQRPQLVLVPSAASFGTGAAVTSMQ